MRDTRVVTLAERYGAGGSQIGPRVAERLGVQFLDHGIVRSVAQRTGLTEAAVAEVDQEPRSRWNRLLDALGRASPPSGASGQAERLDLQEHQLHREIERFLADVSRAGAVVLGRGGGIVLASVPGALHVYLGGSREGRIERVMKLDGDRPRNRGPPGEGARPGAAGLRQNRLRNRRQRSRPLPPDDRRGFARRRRLRRPHCRGERLLDAASRAGDPARL